MGLVLAALVLSLGCRWIGSKASSRSWTSERQSLAASFDRSRFEMAEVGGLPVGFTRSVPNDLILAATEGGVALTGWTGPTAEYQLVSVPIPIGPKTEALILSVEGEVLEGGVYCAILDRRGRFLGSAQTLMRGAIQLSGELVPPGRNSSVAIVIGNGAPGARSRWSLRAIRLHQLNATERAQRLQSHARKLRFDGGAWTWALRTLRQAGTTSPR